MKLSKEQYKIVYEELKDMLVIAGAGSGKTTVLIERIKYIKSKYNDINILAVTFTKKAQIQMKQRLKDDSVDILTFDALFYQYIEKNKELFLVEESPFNSNEVLKYYLYEANSGFSFKPKGYNKFINFKESNNLMDYQDLTINYLKLLNKNLVKKYDLVLIDEFQDINLPQLNVIYKLKESGSIIFAVGDPDQSIYGFRGSFPNVIEYFYHDTLINVYYLTNNYRSCLNILKLANNQISFNQRLFKKDLNPTKTTKGSVEIIKIKNNDNLYETIKKDFESNDYSTYAILYRTHEVGYQIKQKVLFDGLEIDCLTVHQAKGLEYDCVYLIGVEEAIFPSFNQKFKQGYEEERRLFYVAITRAKEKLIMFYFNKISPFLKGD